MLLASPQRLSGRADTARASLDAYSIDALLVTHLPNITYLTNLAATAAVALLTRDALHLIADARYAAQADAVVASSGGAIRLVEIERTYEETTVHLVLRLGLTRLGFEASSLTFRRHAHLADSLAGVMLVPTDRVVEQQRVVKDEDEVATLRAAGRLLAQITPAVLDLVREGVSEAEVAGDVDRLIRRAGFERPAFDTIVASGPRGALPHARAGRRRVGRNEALVLDFGGVYDGYCVDLTRTVLVGPAPADVCRTLEAVRAAQAAAIAAVRPGVTNTAVDAAARNALRAHGFPDAYRHGTGHGLGLELHEEPRISAAAVEQVLAPGMVFTVEPGAYFPGRFGVRIEDDILVTANGCEVLTQTAR